MSTLAPVEFHLPDPVHGALPIGVCAPTRTEMRRLVRSLLRNGFSVECTAYDARELAVEARLLHVEAVVLHVGHDVGTLGDTVATLRRSLGPVSVVVVTYSTERRDVRAAISSDVDGLVLDSQMALTLPIAVRAARSGQFSVPRQARVDIDRPALSYRQRQVLAGVAEGLTNDQIAQRMHVSASTVKADLRASFLKLGVRSRREAAAVALDQAEARV